jgi:hypothetical protein
MKLCLTATSNITRKIEELFVLSICIAVYKQEVKCMIRLDE